MLDINHESLMSLTRKVHLNERKYRYNFKQYGGEGCTFVCEELEGARAAWLECGMFAVNGGAHISLHSRGPITPSRASQPHPHASEAQPGQTAPL